MKFTRIGLFVFLTSMMALAACSPQPTTESAATPGGTESAATATPGKPATPTAAAPNKATPAAPVVPAAPQSVMVPAGTKLSVILIDSLSSEKNKAGDQFLASLGAPLIVDGKTIAEKGAKVRGRVVAAEGSGRVKGLASMSLVLNGIMDGDEVISIVTKPFVVEAEATKGRDAAVAGGGAGIGAAIGAVTGGKKGAGLGALIGGAAGAGAVLATKGNEVEFGSESKLTFTLDKEAELPVRPKAIS